MNQLPLPEPGSRTPRRLLFYAGSLRGNSLDEGPYLPRVQLLVDERLEGGFRKDREPEGPTLVEELQWLDAEERIDIIDLAPVGLKGCALRSHGNMPSYFPPAAPAPTAPGR